MRINHKLFEKAKGIILDVGCGLFKQPGAIGMDMMKHPNVDIKHDVQKFPWPVPDNICYKVVMSHLWEHIEPKYRFQMMDECWRICRHDGSLWISAPYMNSYLESAHPAHYMCPNEATFEFFDPRKFLWHSCSYKKPLPWRIVQEAHSLGGTIEIVLTPMKNKRGKALPTPEKPEDMGCVQLVTRPDINDVQVTWPKKKRKKVAKCAKKRR